MSSTDGIESSLQQGLTDLSINVSCEQVKKLKAYLLLLQKWNKTYNLTAINDLQEMVSLHILDSLTILPYIQGSKLLDVGTGAGLPGIPLAMINPQWSITLLDSNGKKTRFLTQAKLELGLKNVTVIKQRMEDYYPCTRFDCIISRAYSEITKFIETTKQAISTHGCWLALKGTYPEQELTRLNNAGLHYQVKPLTVPQLSQTRHLVIITKHEDSLR